MKFSFKSTAVLSSLMLFVLLVSGCKKKEDEFVRIQTIVPQAIIDELKSKGMAINDGVNPPTLDDAYVMDPFELESPYGAEDPWQKGKIIDAYYYQFYGQNDRNEIFYDFYNEDKGDVGEGAGAFIAGDGKKFTIFSEEDGQSDDVSYKRVTIISGELASNGIKDFQYAFVLKEKGPDPDGDLIPVNKGRLWFDGDAISEEIDNFRMAAGSRSAETGTGKSVLSVK